MPKPSRPAAWPHPYPKACLLALMLAGTLRDQGVSAGMRARIVAGKVAA